MKTKRLFLFAVLSTLLAWSVLLACRPSSSPALDAGVLVPDASADASLASSNAGRFDLDSRFTRPHYEAGPNPKPSGPVLASSPSSSGTVAVYQPGGTPGPFTYTTLTALKTQWGSFQGPLTVFCDPQFAVGATTCSWDTSVTLASRLLTLKCAPNTSGFGFPTINFVTGGTLSLLGNNLNVEDCQLQSSSTSPGIAFTGGTGNVTIDMYGSSTLSTNGSAPLIQYATTSAGDTLTFDLYDSALLLASAGSSPEVLNLTGNSGSMFIQGYGRNLLFDHVLGAPHASQITLQWGANARTVSTTQPGILDTGTAPTPTPLGVAASIAYTNAHYPGVTTVAGALDFLDGGSSGGGGGALTGTCNGGFNPARPAATGSGKTYACTDAPLTYIDDPTTSSWQQFASGIGPTSDPPDAGAYTLSSNVTALQVGDSVVVSCAQGGQKAGLVAASLPQNGTWIVRGKLYINEQFNNGSLSAPYFGIGVSTGTSSGASNIVSWFSWLNAGHAASAATQGTLNTTSVADLGTDTDIGWYAPGHAFFRILSDGDIFFGGGNLHFQRSNDGYWWQDIRVNNPGEDFSFYGFVCGSNSNTNTANYGTALVAELFTGPLTATQKAVSTGTATTPIVLTLNNTTGLQNNDYVFIRGIAGLTGANSSFNITVSGSTITLLGSTGGGSYVSGGRVTLLSR